MEERRDKFKKVKDDEDDKACFEISIVNKRN